MEITLRDQIPIEIREGSGTWGWAYGGSLHLTDLPWNAWPSLHIFQSLLIVLTIDYWLKNDVFEASQLDNDNKRMGEMNNLKL
ncbi:MAG: hypothetical protein H8D82_00160, partial [Euryarchaeota archaeon]|nr:hypothetical protein [Euryarchaeota archaeon]